MVEVRERGERRISRDEYRDRILRAVDDRVASLILMSERTATPAPSAEEVIREILDLPALAAAPSELGEEVGPFYDTSGVTKLLHVTKQAVGDRIRNGTILALTTSDRKTVFPVFQFDGGKVSPRLGPAIRALSGLPRWSVALWFVTSSDDLGERTPLEWSNAGFSVDELTLAAQRAARDWR
ncbi:hypothetical protein FOE78_11735 [Microlunatus elymi]|uniref:Uncharacterized protein n=1 Tax=Microlunatus elymi TaxID=2596828 RepID=A0A516PZ82_9ACTN|nr:hypothetical protein [Microlunatus elymi]QDP96485.1 hypothetical protein FOE78_11735 [Microlunatus elymi]